MEENATARCRRYDPRYKVRCILGPDQDHTHEHDAFVVELPVGVECSADVTPEQSIDALDDALRHARNALWDAQHELREVHAANEGMGLALTELKKIDLIGPLTAEEWLEFRLRREEDEDHELLRCCANTSAIRDDIFHLMRSYAEDPLLGRTPMRHIMHGINGHIDLITGPHPAGLRLHELLTRMAAYYGVPMDYVHDDDPEHR